MKKILIGVVVVVVLAVGGVVYFASNLDSIIKTAVEKFGSEATRTKVTLSSVDLSLSSGAAALNGFRMGNPDGFKTEKAMSFGKVAVKVDTNSLTGDVIVIKEVLIDGPDISYEGGLNGSNFDAIQKNVDAYANSLGADGKKKATKEENKKEGSKKIIIEHFYVRNGKVALNSPVLLGKTVFVPLPEIHLTDIGKKDNGATPAEVASVLVDEITGKIVGVGKEGLASAVKMGKEAAEGARKMLEGTGGGAGKALGGATDSIKGLFGK